MLKSLSIENYALIEKLTIEFSGGFSIITGETGAGKSILLGALGLVLGKRADISSLKDKERKCVIEAQFNISGYGLQEVFESNMLDYEDETIIRREILPSGKTRSFVNDSPVNLQDLLELSSYLIDIHSQYDTRELSEETFQFIIVDALAGNNPLISDYALTLKQYRKTKSELNELETRLAESEKEKDYNQFLLNELIEARLSEGEQEELESVQNQLSNVEDIRESFGKAEALATDDQFGVRNLLKDFRLALQKTAGFSADYESLYKRASSVSIEFDDIASEISAIADKLQSDPEKLEQVSQKLQIIYSLQKKHQVQTVEQLISITDELQTKVDSADQIQDQIESMRSQLNIRTEELRLKAAAIHAKRVEAVPILSEQLTGVLSLLGMKDARFLIEVHAQDKFFENGSDQINFLFSANKGSQFGLLKKVASGGELSRIMLAVKSILAGYSKLPAIIFDEIDTGVSGEVANKMALIMKGMSQTMQVFAITHLPQIAARGEQHFKVFKSESAGIARSNLKLLTEEERVTEIAQMLSGEQVSDSAINHAKALLN